MKAADHSALIDRLVQQVEAGPLTEEATTSHIQACWTLIKRIGPAFKEIDHGHPTTRQQQFTRFQKAVTTLKALQSDWEKSSAALRLQLSQRLEALRPEPSMDDLSHEFRPAGMPKEEAAPHILLDKRKIRLQGATDEHAEILKEFMLIKGRLTPTDFKTLADTLRAKKRDIQKQWDHFRSDGKKLNTKAPRPKAGPKSGPEARRQRAAAAAKEQDLYLLDHKRKEIATMEASLAAATDPQRKEQLARWIAEARRIVEELSAASDSPQA